MSALVNRRNFLKSLSMLSLSALLNGPALLSQGPSDVSPGSQALPGPDVSLPGDRPNVLFVVFDSFSAMDMSLYGYRRKTTPRLEELAERATVYHAHYAGGNYTTPGTSSLLTGVYPWSHRAFNSQGTFAPEFKEQNMFRLLAALGYNSIAYSNNWTAHLCLYQLRHAIDALLSPSELSLYDRVIADRLFAQDADIAYRTEHFFLRGIRLNRVRYMPGSLAFSLVDEVVSRNQRTRVEKEYGDLYPKGVPDYSTSSFLLEEVMDGLHTRVSRARQPFVAYFQPLPPHSPYRPRREFVGRFDSGWEPKAKARHYFHEGWPDELLAKNRRTYDEFVALVDAEFGRLYDQLEQSGILENTYVILTSDHGEMFERGIFQHSTPTLYEPITHIPLLIFKPGQQRREDVYTPTSCVDLLPTLLHLNGQAVPGWCEGQVLPTFGESKASQQRAVFTVEAKSNAQYAPLTRATVSMIEGPYKLVHYAGYKGYESKYELYDLSNDPEEMEDLVSSRPSIVADLSNKLHEKLGKVNQPYMAG